MLRLVNDVIPAEVRCLFPFPCFNDMQGQVFEQALHTDNNVVVAAPTGSGKTAILELALARLILNSRNETFRCVYIAPSKALCQQRWTEWKIKLEPLQLQVLEVTGDVDWKDVIKSISNAAIIITTPEKWDALTRMWRENVFMLGLIDLLLLDEIHHLAEDRGAVLEAVVVRLRMINQICNSDLTHRMHCRMRIVALSATLPNISDVGKWLQCEPQCVYYFDDRYRPVPLRVLCYGYECKGNQYLFEKSLDRHLGNLLNAYAGDRQTIIFCASKKGTQSCAAYLKINNLVRGPAQDQTVRFSCAQMQDRALAELIPFGVAYHHAGLPPDDRMMVEQLFLRGSLRILCSTSTLAHGMNLPAHLVIVKGTYAWRGAGKGYERLKRSDVIQMLGRAGRPGFDEEGIAVIMTSTQEQPHYSSVSLHADVVESNLPLLLHEAIAAEISQRVIGSLNTAIEWMRSTYYYIRLKAAPCAERPDEASLDMFLTDLCLRTLKALEAAKLITMSEDGAHIEALPEAHIMSKSLIKFSSMKLLLSLTASMKLNQLIKAFSHCEELHKPVRRTEKKLLNDLMKTVRFPQRERVQEPHQKCYVLLQVAVGGVDIKDFSLRIEQADIVENATRLLKGLQELCIHRGLGCLLEAAILLERALRTRLWEGAASCQFAQCPGLSATTLKTLQDNGIKSVTDLYGSSLVQVQARVNCSSAEARSLLHFAASLHRCKLTAQMLAADDHMVKIKVDLAEAEGGLTGLQAIPFLLLAYDVDTAQLVCFRRLPVGCQGAEFVIKLPQTVAGVSSLRCRILGSLVGADFTCGAAMVEEPKIPPKTAASSNLRTNQPRAPKNGLSATEGQAAREIATAASRRPRLPLATQPPTQQSQPPTTLQQENQALPRSPPPHQEVNFDRFRLINPADLQPSPPPARPQRPTRPLHPPPNLIQQPLNFTQLQPPASQARIVDKEKIPQDQQPGYFVQHEAVGRLQRRAAELHLSQLSVQRPKPAVIRQSQFTQMTQQPSQRAPVEKQRILDVDSGEDGDRPPPSNPAPLQQPLVPVADYLPLPPPSQPEPRGPAAKRSFFDISKDRGQDEEDQFLPAQWENTAPTQEEALVSLPPLAPLPPPRVVTKSKDVSSAPATLRKAKLSITQHLQEVAAARERAFAAAFG